jgi:hypothetical protein
MERCRTALTTARWIGVFGEREKVLFALPPRLLIIFEPMKGSLLLTKFLL